MKSFNKTITVEVSVDDIATKLLNTISDSFPHREMLVETIIATGLQASSLNYLFLVSQTNPQFYTRPTEHFGVFRPVRHLFF